jgi:hypothetical protein
MAVYSNSIMNEWMVVGDWWLALSSANGAAQPQPKATPWVENVTSQKAL